MKKLSLEQPQVVGYFVRANGRPLNAYKRSKVDSKKCCITPPRFTKAMYSKPMQVLLLHIFLQIVPFLSINLTMVSGGGKPSCLHVNITYILGSLGICFEAVVYLFLNAMILRHFVTRSRIHPSHQAPPAPARADAAVVLRDYSWTLTKLNAQWGLTVDLTRKIDSIQFSSI